MKAEDIRDWDDVEIKARIDELREEGFRLRFSSSMMELENPAVIRQVRRDIARLRTVLREREIAQDTEQQTAAAGH